MVEALSLEYKGMRGASADWHHSDATRAYRLARSHSAINDVGGLPKKWSVTYMKNQEVVDLGCGHKWGEPPPL
jgi:hypothetical protein